MKSVVCVKSGLTIVMLMLGGCVSTGPDTDVINETGLMGAKVGFCEGSISFEEVTRYIGNNPQLSPEERQKKKSESVTEWNKTKQEAADWIKKDQFSAYHFIQFLTTEHAIDGLLPLNLSFVTNVEGRFLSNIPQDVLFTYSSNRDYAEFYPKHAVTGTGNVHGDKRKIKRFILSRYQNTTSEEESLFVINHVRDEGYGKVNINYNASFANIDEDALGVRLKIPEWFKRPDSPIVKKDNQFFLDTKKLDFNATFDAYPDAYAPRVMVNYIYTLDRCEGNDLFGEVKKVELWPVKFDRTFASGEPLATFTF